MTTLTNAKHEHFALLLARGETAPKAYVLAGYSEQGAAQSANRLLKNAEVAKRVSELRSAVSERSVEKAAIDRAWVLERLIENATRAAAAEDFGPSNKALELLGKELGMFVDSLKVRSDVAVTHKSDDLSATSRWLDEFAGSGETPALPSPLPN